MGERAVGQLAGWCQAATLSPQAEALGVSPWCRLKGLHRSSAVRRLQGLRTFLGTPRTDVLLSGRQFSGA